MILQELIKRKACTDGIQFFVQQNLQELIGQKIRRLTVYSYDEFELIEWFIKEFKYGFIKCLRYEDSNGLRRQRTYNEQGLEIRYENSEGFWLERTYNKQGLETRYENSEGCINEPDYSPQQRTMKIEK